MLRRQLAKLIAELEELDTAEKFAVPVKKKKKKKEREKGDEGKGDGDGDGDGENKYVLAAREKIELRARFLRRWVLGGGCYL